MTNKMGKGQRAKHNGNLTKVLLWTLFSALILFSALSITKLNPNEDINMLLPDKDGHKLIDFRQFSAFTDRIYFIIYYKDNNSKEAYELISYGDSLTGFLDSLKTKGLVGEIAYDISGEQTTDLFNVFYENLPLFLNENDYSVLDSLLSERNIAESLKSGYRTMLSPAGMMYHDIFLKDPLHFTQIVFNRLKKISYSENLKFIDGHIFSKNGDQLLFSMLPGASYNKTKTNIELFRIIDQKISSLNRTFPDLDVRYFGAPVVAAGNSIQIRRDITVTVSIAFVLIFALIYFYFRRFEYVFLILLPAVTGGIIALGIIAHIKDHISVISLGIGAILLGITVDYALHILNHYQEKKSVRLIYRNLWSPVLMSAFTTISAFLCLLVLHTEALTDLALFSAFSIFSASAFSLLVLPQILTGRSANFSNNKWINRLISLKIIKSKTIFLVIIVIALGAIFIPGKVMFDSELDHINYMSERTKEARDMLDPLLGVSHKNILLTAKGNDVKNALEISEKVYEKYQHTGGGRDKLISPLSLLRSDSVQRLRIRRWEQYWTPEKRELVQESFLHQCKILGIKTGAFEPFFHMISKKYKPLDTAVVVKIANTFFPGFIIQKNDSVKIISILKVAPDREDAAVKDYAGLDNIDVFSKKEMIIKLVNFLKTSFSKLVWLSMAAVFLVLLVFVGRIELAFVGFIPIVLSWTFLLGLMKLTGIRFNIVNVIVSTFIFGLGIDYSIFILKGLMQKYASGEENLQSYKKSILLSAATTVIGIGVLLFARHPALKSIAVVAVPGIITVLIITFTVEPALFRFLIYRGQRKRWVPLTFGDFWLSFFGIGTFILSSILASVSVFIISVLPVNLFKRKLIFHHFIQKMTWFLIFFRITIKTRFINDQRKSLKRPALIISNHQSPLDIPVLLSFYPKLIILTKNWVQKTWIFRLFVKFADYHDMTSGLDDKLINILRRMVDEGYSIIVFPEGTRSERGNILRFKKGAFLLAEQLKLDILPVVIHGSWRCLPKNEPVVRSGLMTVRFLDRIRYDDPAYGQTLLERSKAFRKLYIDVYSEMKAQVERPRFFRMQLIRNYLYKGPVLEWYLKIKLHVENNYEQFDRILPKSGLITDLGCGYGFISYMLHFTSDNRQLLGVDNDCDKINTANNCVSKNDRIQFLCEDITTFNPTKSAAFLLVDVLHYLDYDKQKELIRKCVDALEPEGIILIREGNAEIKNKHLWTRLTEFLSTKITRFNKSGEKLYFTSEERLREIVVENGFVLVSQKDSSITSNTIFTIKKEKQSESKAL